MRTQGLLFAALFFGSAFFQQPRQYDNTESRYMLLASIVDEGRLSIDTFHDATIDKAFWNGHYYSNKAIGLPFLAVPAYAVLQALASDPRQSIMNDPAAQYFIRLGIVSLPFAALGLILFRLLLVLGAPPRAALWACIAHGFGTIAFNHAILFSGHATSAFFLFSSFALLFHAGRRTSSAALAGLAGFCAGAAVLCDYIAIFAALVLAWYALASRLGIAAKASFAAAAGLCALALAWYNQACFGSVASLSYAHNAYDEFRQGAAAGLFGISWPSARALAALLASPARGLFFISPVLLLSLVGLARLGRRADLRRELVVLAAAPAATLLACSGFYGWDGGWSFGPRYLTAVLPFLAAGLAFTADESPVFCLLLGLSILQVGCAQLGWPHVDIVIRNPIHEIILPLMREGGTSLSLLGQGKPGTLAAGLVQGAALAAVIAMAFRGLKSGKIPALPLPWKTIMGGWSACVVLGLALLKTVNQRDVHKQRAILLNDVAWVINAPELAQAAQREFLLAREK